MKFAIAIPRLTTTIPKMGVRAKMSARKRRRHRPLRILKLTQPIPRPS